jgi:hypothetical protein
LAQRRALRHSWVILAVFAAIIILMTSLLTTAPTSDSPTAKHPVTEALIFLPYVLIFLVAWAFIHWWQRRQFAARQMQKFGPLQRPRAFWFTPHGISMREPLVSAEYLWQAFVEWRETADLFILYFSDSGAAELIMKAGIGDAAALERFRQMLRNCIRPDWHSVGFPVMAPPQPPLQVSQRW